MPIIAMYILGARHRASGYETSHPCADLAIAPGVTLVYKDRADRGSPSPARFSQVPGATDAKIRGQRHRRGVSPAIRRPVRAPAMPRCGVASRPRGVGEAWEVWAAWSDRILGRFRSNHVVASQHLSFSITPNLPKLVGGSSPDILDRGDHPRIGRPNWRTPNHILGMEYHAYLARTTPRYILALLDSGDAESG